MLSDNIKLKRLKAKRTSKLYGIKQYLSHLAINYQILFWNSKSLMMISLRMISVERLFLIYHNAIHLSKATIDTTSNSIVRTKLKSMVNYISPPKFSEWLCIFYKSHLFINKFKTNYKPKYGLLTKRNIIKALNKSID